ncbi:hypothetical protein FA95DRAFT_1505344 [Auriscalpium vulgare]|uniref:Uncharacterized protein n=1 Tax=Auriscalpium vulgare TaxID=40419 RepID=A0ACB8R3A0_9AGAM|nr:hypothetical protein FA95DRAFT_1505344 [Auriscalpium vulgare]
MRYSPDTVEFAQIVQILNKPAYQVIRSSLPMPTDRTLEQRRAREIQFPIGITPRTFQLIVDRLKQLSYTGPVGLACDDTKLHAALRPYWDQQRKCHVLLGGVGEPLVIVDPENLSAELQKGRIQKATKIRVWTIQIPLPGVSTMVLAALAISETEDASSLFGYLKTILKGLLSHGINVVSYAADGTSTERLVQRALSDWAVDYNDYQILHPRGRAPLNLHIPLVGAQRQPIALIQDSNHGRKTYRNNAFSGARILTLGNFTTLYSHFRMAAHEDSGTLYRRDVEKMDRQDDNAATRLFSGHTLHWFNSTHSELVGTIVYLFVFGELIDAYQNRFLPLLERVEMVLRAHYFMEMWDKFLTSAGYAKSKHFLSSEARDITHFLVNGFLQLVIIYRDHLQAEYPLLPWLLSTEVCEHVFGICRQIVKDFTLQDFHYMVPKLSVRLRQHFFLSHTSDGKERASGYNHTYTDSRKLDLANLAAFPSDFDIRTASETAFDGAEGLWAELGVRIEAQVGRRERPVGNRVPPIDSWWDDEDPTDSDDNDSDEDEESEIRQIEDALAMAQNHTLTHQREEEVNGLTYAAAALIAQTSMTILEMPEESEHDRQSEAAKIADHLAQMTLPSVRDPHERNDATGAVIYDHLVRLRLEHHTMQAEKGVRTRAYRSDAADRADATPGVSAAHPEQKLLLHKIREILHGVGDRGVGTGMERSARWRLGASGAKDGEVAGPAAGSAANAFAVATAAAVKVRD